MTKLLRGALVQLLMVMVLLVGLADVATAGGSDSVDTDDDTVIVRGVRPGTPGTGWADAAPAYRDCTTVSLALATFMVGFDAWTGVRQDITTTKSIAWQTCYLVATGQEVGCEAPRVS